MRSSFIIGFILQVCASAFAQEEEPFNITAIAACPRGKSTLECWQFKERPTITQTKGVAGSVQQQLGFIGGEASYLVLPPNFSGTPHNAPTKQYV